MANRPVHAQFCDTNCSVLDYVETGHLTRLGLEPVIESFEWQDHLNNNQMGHDSLRVLTFRYQGTYAWILTVMQDCRHAFRPGDSELTRWLDEIVYVANDTETALFVAIDLVTFSDDPNEPNPISNEQPQQAERLRNWLIKEYAFTSHGKTPNGLGELVGIDPNKPHFLSYGGVPCAAALQSFFRRLKQRLENGSDRAWVDREEHKLVAALKARND